jgi:hypothetical protein
MQVMHGVSPMDFWEGNVPMTRPLKIREWLRIKFLGVKITRVREIEEQKEKPKKLSNR